MSTSWQGVDANLHDGYTYLAQIVVQAGGVLVLTSTIRTVGEQTRLYKRYLAGLSGGIPAAPPYHSAHEYGLAFDAVCNPAEWQPDVGTVWTQMGGAYGGTKDPVHFELVGAHEAAWQAGEQQAPVGETAPRTQSTGGIGLLPQRWKNYIYSAEDIALGFVPVAGQVEMVATLLRLGYPDKEILKILASPVSELHQLFPNIPF